MMGEGQLKKQKKNKMTRKTTKNSVQNSENSRLRNTNHTKTRVNSCDPER